VLVAAAGAMVAERNDRIYADAPVVTHLEHDLRPAIWRTAAQVIADAPLLGHGFGREIRADAFRALKPEGGEHPEVHHAHNVFLDVAVQLGFVGLAVFVALLATLAAAHARLLASPRAAPLGLLGLIVIAGFVTKNLTDDFFHRHNAQVFWALNGLLLGLGRRLAR
jgi:O-antigen ligase